MNVKAWVEEIVIPTYKTGEPDKNPMFLEKRVYQGSSGVVYPHAVIDKVYDEKENKTYKAVFLENQYLKIMILPELGGRIQMALDKTNEYHFVYYNQVIKPALVGLAGPWISGGIEFNWPQHHRPSTFDPVDFGIEENEDGSKTVWVNEIEQMFHTKGMAGFTLYADKAYLEIKGQLFNRTLLPQSFLWWANPAVSVDETYQSVFPPDVQAVYDHGRRAVSSFPIATGTYYKVDYSPGTDISWYSNIPVPTSYMAVRSSFDFVGGYNHGRHAGMLHVANHHISPGKKQWTWGSGEFGKAWDRQLTDNDGPYCELMTGVFTDNQPDFGWIMPGEERTFRQYFMPYKNIGVVKNATIDALVNLELTGVQAKVKVYVTAVQNNLSIRLLYANELILEERADLSPVHTFDKLVSLPDEHEPGLLQVTVHDEKGKLLVSYIPVAPQAEDSPQPVQPIASPPEIVTTEGLYFAGLHLEQYRHATYSPVDYYAEALKRDPSDVRNNTALGRWYLRHGQFSLAESCFRKAVKAQQQYNSNPYDGEPLFNLGLSLFYQQKSAAAYELFFKATWNAAWQHQSFLQLARIDCMNRNYQLALEHITLAVQKNSHGMQSRHLKAALLRKTGSLQEAELLVRETLLIDPFDFGSGNELYLLLKERGEFEAAGGWLEQLTERMRDAAHNYIEVALDYSHAGLYEEAIALLARIAIRSGADFLYYYIAYFHLLKGENEIAELFTRKGFAAPCNGFTNRLEDICMLQGVSGLDASDHKVLYYLGNIWYDKRQYDEAISAWERSVKLFDGFPTVHRNLGIAYFNKQNNHEKALTAFEKAFQLDPGDSRILYEFDQLKKRLNVLPAERLAFLLNYSELVNDRDDLYSEFVALNALTGKYAYATQLLAKRNFHPWEGGEGKLSSLHVLLQTELAKIAIREKRYTDAIQLLHAASRFPENLGEGKLYGTPENDVHYWMGCALESIHHIDEAKKYFELASQGSHVPQPAIYYNDPSPDKIYYQGLALMKLQRFEEAQLRFHALIEYGNTYMEVPQSVDYFAVSFPDLLIFDENANTRNLINCHYLTGLGKLGIDRLEEACDHLHKVLELDVSHQGAIRHGRSIVDSRIPRFQE